MPFTTWIRDLFGIRKDVIDTKKAQLEITKLEDEESERRGLIELATSEDVEKYDSKLQRLKRKIAEFPLGYHDKMLLAPGFLWIRVLIYLFWLLTLLSVIWYVRRR